MNLEDRLGLPVRLGGPGSGPVARLMETPEGVVSEVWRPDSGTWERGSDLATVMSSPPAEPGLLARVGVPVADGGFRFRDLIGLPLRVGGAPAGPVARFALTPKGVVSETWVPEDGWVRDLHAPDLLLVAPFAGPELLEELGVPERDAEEIPAELLDVVEEGFSRVVRQLLERHEHFREEQRKMRDRRQKTSPDSPPDWEAAELRARKETLDWAEENPEEFEELVNPDRSPPSETSSDDE